MVLPRGFVQQEELAADVERAKRTLGPEVVRLRHRVREDYSGEPAIYFQIVLSDFASREERLAGVTRRISDALFQSVGPYEKWGLTPYFSFRSQSEQATRNDPEWS